MDDLFAKMQEILGSEEGQEQLKSMAQMFGGEDGRMPDLSALGDLFGSSEENDNPPPADESQDEGGFDFSGIDLNLILQMQKLFSVMSQEDENTRLLLALKPHFSEERKEKVDKAVKILKLLSLLPLLKESGLLGGLFGDANTK